MYNLARMCVVLAVAIGVGRPAVAVDYFWTNTNGGAYDEPSHWTPFSPPALQGPGGASDTVNFDLGVPTVTPYFVTDASRENSQLVVHNDSLLFSVFVDYELSSTGGANPSFVVGAASGDEGFISLFGGGVSVLDTQVVRIGNVAGSAGSVRVDALEWNSGNFRVGHAGDGTMAMDVDASINSTNASIAHLTGSTGRAVVQGHWDVSGNFIVGRQGEGAVEITSGGIVTSNTAVVGDQSTGDGEVIVNATWTTAGSLTVGDSGAGQLVITGSLGNVTSGDAFLGRSAGSRGLVVASGAAWTVNGRLSIGGDADAATPGGDGLVEIVGGAVTVAEDITLFPDGQISMVGGSLDAPIITVEPGGLVDWAGGTLFVDTFQGNLPNNGGILAARDGSNSILVTGEYSQGPLGILSIGITGDAASQQYDKLTVGNTAFLGGVLQVEIAEAFVPGPDEVYTILDALNLGAGAFSNVANGDRLHLDFSKGSFVVNYGPESPFDPSQVVLSQFLPSASADFDSDKDVDHDDLEAWQAGYGVGTQHSQGDADFDLDVDGSDFLIWQRQFGLNWQQLTSAVPRSPLVSIPEPPVAVLCCLALIVMSPRRELSLLGR